MKKESVLIKMLMRMKREPFDLMVCTRMPLSRINSLITNPESSVVSDWEAEKLAKFFGNTASFWKKTFGQ